MDMQRLIDAMQAIAPLELAAEWDNVGLLLGAPGDPLPAGARVLLTIDVTEAVMAEAGGAAPAAAIVAYHPPIFEPIKRLNGSDPMHRVLLAAARQGTAIFSPHTALDAAPDAMSDWLADAVMEGGPAGGVAEAGGATGDRRALIPHAALRASEQVKIVTFVPPGKVEAVRGALASSGAGQIGAYSACSFAVPGTGTFLGAPDTRPAIGQPGRLEEAGEVRLEMVCSRAALALAIEALRQFHPYQEPAIDVYPLHPRPRRGTGIGRRVVLDRPVTMAALAARVRAWLGVQAVQLARSGPEGRLVSSIAVCPGAGGSLWETARAQGCEVFITGEMKHHEVLAAVRSGISVVLAGHTNTERGYLPRLRDRLAKMLPEVRFEVSAADGDPLVLV